MGRKKCEECIDFLCTDVTVQRGSPVKDIRAAMYWKKFRAMVLLGRAARTGRRPAGGPASARAEPGARSEIRARTSPADPCWARSLLCLGSFLRSEVNNSE